MALRHVSDRARHEGSKLIMNSSGPIAVVGATGRQGSATVNALLDRGLPVGGLTRHVDSDAAKGLARLGAEVVEADLADPRRSVARSKVRRPRSPSPPSGDTASRARSPRAKSSVMPPRRLAFRSWCTARWPGLSATAACPNLRARTHRGISARPGSSPQRDPTRVLHGKPARVAHDRSR